MKLDQLQEATLSTTPDAIQEIKRVIQQGAATQRHPAVLEFDNGLEVVEILNNAFGDGQTIKDRWQWNTPEGWWISLDYMPNSGPTNQEDYKNWVMGSTPRSRVIMRPPSTDTRLP
jgi:hypothetical protein